MNFIEVIIGLLFLIICSYYDIKKRLVYCNVCILFGIIGIFVEIVLINSEAKELLFGLIPGILIYIISIFTNESIGKGDAYIFMVIGIILGFVKSILILILALMLIILLSIPLLAIKHKNLKSSFPFSPFVLTSFIVCLLL